MARGERIVSLDILRGGAVLGILLANITGFAQSSLAYYWPPALVGGANAADGWIWVGQLALIDGKLRGLFTVLFGAGLVMFFDRAGGGRQALVLQSRRLALLCLFGLAHFYLLFVGDVLFAYATSGFLALLALSWRAQNLLAVGIVMGVTGAVLLIGQFAPPAIAEAKVLAGGPVPVDWPAMQDYWSGELAQASAERAAMAGDSLRDLLQYRWAEEGWRLSGTLSYNFLETIPLVLIGMGLYRAGVFSNGAARASCRGLAVAGVVLGIGLNLLVALYVLSEGFPPLLTQLAFFGLAALFNLPFVLGAAVLLTDVALKIRDGWLGERLALAGKMAFSNYIGTSLVMALVFQGWAGGLFGTLHRAELLLVVLMGWAMMLTGSRLWLARFRYGPLEWVWRCLTYGRLFPNRL